MAEMGSFETYTITTGGEAEVGIIERSNEFFVSVLNGLGMAINNPFTEITTMSLGFENPDGFHPSDDRLHRLVVFDELVAMVADRRNDYNFHEVTFWQNAPSQSCLGKIAAARAFKNAE